MTPLVLDTSVLINLDSSRFGERIVGALPHDIIVPEIVVSELLGEDVKCNSTHRFVQEIVATSKVSIVALTGSEYRLFGRLVSGKLSLDDGEAATIAIGFCRGYLPIIDERKGRQEARSCLGGKCPGWSLCLFRHPRVVASLGRRRATEALYFALRDGRMRVHESHCDEVVNLIGAQRALECYSLPGYKVRRVQWLQSDCLPIEVISRLP